MIRYVLLGIVKVDAVLGPALPGDDLLPILRHDCSNRSSFRRWIEPTIASKPWTDAFFLSSHVQRHHNLCPGLGRLRFWQHLASFISELRAIEYNTLRFLLDV